MNQSLTSVLDVFFPPLAPPPTLVLFFPPLPSSASPFSSPKVFRKKGHKRDEWFDAHQCRISSRYLGFGRFPSTLATTGFALLSSALAFLFFNFFFHSLSG
jgi:hypothetical protein